MTGSRMEEHDARNISGEVDKQKHRVVELARRLIGFKTENPAPANESGGNEAVKQGLECQQFIAERLKALGFSIDQWRLKTGLQNLVAVLKGSGGGRTILFNGHIDTVPAGDLRAWKHDPWEADISGGRICGLGSVDMKGGVAAFISAIEVALSQGLDLKGDVVVEIVPDEEMAGPGTRECLEKGYRGDAALFGEPTDLAVVVCEPGLIHLRIEVFGRGAHSSTRYQSIHAGGKGYGVNAIEKMIKVM
ncbi:MAG: M20/M25/M40 family metallo-hydrolase, partial [Candidatus Bathyarchaeia archaeon]